MQVYNIIFIPLQGAYRIRFTPVLITIEIFVILFYFIDIVLLLLKYRKISKNLKKISFELETSNNIVWKPVDVESK